MYLRANMILIVINYHFTQLGNDFKVGTTYIPTTYYVKLNEKIQISAQFYRTY